MLAHFALLRQFHGPLIALAVALGLVAAGRFLRVGLLETLAGGAAVAAGWWAITGPPWVVAGGPAVEDLTAYAVIAMLIGLLPRWLGSSRGVWAATLLAALAAAWLFAGAPRHLAPLRADWPTSAGVAVGVLIFTRAIAPGGFDPVRLALATLTLAAALHVAEAPTPWVQLALVPGVAALAVCALQSAAGTAGLPIAADIAAAACLAVITLGRLPRLGFGTADAAALSPLLAVWLLPRAAQRFHRIGQAAPLAGAVLAGAIAVGCVWLLRRAIGHT